MFNMQHTQQEYNGISADGNWTKEPIKRRHDGSYEIVHNNLPFHIPTDGEWAECLAMVDAYAQAHPEQVTDEPAPPQPTEAEMLAQAKSLRTAEIDRAMSEIDAKLARSSSDIVAAMLSPAATEGEAADGTTPLSAEELEQSRAVFDSLRKLQAQNRALRAQVQAAQSVEEVQAVTPLLPDMNTVFAENAQG